MNMSPYRRPLLLFSSLLVTLWLTSCALPPAIAPYFDDSDPALIRVGNPFYEMTLTKNNGAIVSIVDKQRGVTLTDGSRNGCLWGAIYRADSTRGEKYIGGCSFGADQEDFTFHYQWQAATSQLRLDYSGHAELEEVPGTIEVEIAITPSASSWLDLQLTLHNASERVIDQVLFPSDLLIAKADLQQALLPTLPGVLLDQPFFAKRARYDALYPSWQGLFADYVALQMQASSLTLYTIQQPAALESAKVSLINELDETRLVHTFYPYIPGTLATDPSATAQEGWAAPVVRLHFGQPYAATIAAYRRDNRLDHFADLHQKLGERYNAVVQGPLYKIEYDHPPAYWADLLRHVPAPGLLHWVTYWQNGVFDEGYPDYLPPRGSDTAGLADLFAAAHAAGFLNMPYTNPTWWDDESSTVQELGAEALAMRDEPGALRYECTGLEPRPPCSLANAAHDSAVNQGKPGWQWLHGGYPVSPYAPAVQQRISKTIAELTTLGSDLIFEDQVGAGDIHCIPASGDCRNYSPWTPTPTAFRQGWLDHTERHAAVGLMTEVGYDRMAAHEIGFHGSLLLFDQRGETDFWWGPGYWHPYPFATMLLRDKVLFYQHNLAPETFTDNLPTLRWNLAMGYQLSYGLNPVNGHGGADDPWLYAVSLLQRVVLAPYADAPITVFRSLETGVTETRFGDMRVFANWQRTRPYPIAGHTVAPDGFYLTNKAGTLTAGAFTAYNGQALSLGLHLLVEARTPTQITFWQPLGAPGPIALRLPPAWSTVKSVSVTAYTGADRALATATAIPSDGLIEFTYELLLAGQSVDHYTIVPMN